MALAQRIELNGVDYALIPCSAFDEMVEVIEDKIDIASATRVMENLAPDDLLPSHFVDRLLEENAPKLQLWREYRGLTQKELAEKIGIAKNYLSEIERGKKVGSIAIYKKLREVLRCDIDDLV